MSRYGTPASDLGRLAIGSSTSSSGDMPVTTRAMRRGHASGSGSRPSSSRTVAGPSRNNGRSSEAQRGPQRGRQATGNGGGSDDDDEEDSSGSSDEEDGPDLRRQNRTAALEIAAALDRESRTPSELATANPQDAQRRLVNLMADRFRDQADLNALHGVLSQADALQRVQRNLQRRCEGIPNRIAQNVANASQGTTVAGALQEFRTLANAIEQHIGVYGAVLPDNGRSLVGTVFDILMYMTQRDQDVYANLPIPRVQYAGGGNSGNIFREFVREHVWMMSILSRVPAALLRAHQNTLRTVIDRVMGYGPRNGDQAQFQRLIDALRRVWGRCSE